MVGGGYQMRHAVQAKEDEPDGAGMREGQSKSKQAGKEETGRLRREKMDCRKSRRPAVGRRAAAIAAGWGA